MKNLKNSSKESGVNSILVINKIKSAKQFVKFNADHFLKRYDEVLTRNILNVFRPKNEEYDRPHDHRAAKIINGELVNLRLDSLNGQADGIKVTSLKTGRVPIYIWFWPDQAKGKVFFKTVCGEHRNRIRVGLEQIKSDFLLKLISRLFIKVDRLAEA